MHKKWISVGVGIIVLQAAFLYVFGQPPVCECGYVQVWEGSVRSEGNSQHIADWYTPSHIIHGILFFALLSLLFPALPVTTRLIIAIGVESLREVSENTPWVIDRYRQQALAQGYSGDSILNSVCDTLWMIFGYFVASRVRVAVAIGIILVLELFTGYMIRDNLTLNILQLIHPIDAVAVWQSS